MTGPSCVQENIDNKQINEETFSSAASQMGCNGKWSCMPRRRFPPRGTASPQIDPDKAPSGAFGTIIH